MGWLGVRFRARVRVGVRVRVRVRVKSGQNRGPGQGQGQSRASIGVRARIRHRVRVRVYRLAVAELCVVELDEAGAAAEVDGLLLDVLPRDGHRLDRLGWGGRGG